MIAKAFETETAVSKRGVRFVTASGSGIENYGEKKIIGHTEDGEGVTVRTQSADAKKVLGSVRKMNMGGRRTRRRTRRPASTTSRGHVRSGTGEGRRSCEGDGEGAEGQSPLGIGHGE